MLDDTDRWMCTVHCAGTISVIRPPTLVNKQEGGGGRDVGGGKQVMEVEVVEVIEVYKVEVE